MVIEMSILGVFCPPYFDFEFSGSMLNGEYTYSYDSIIAILTTLRLFLVARLYIHISIWLSDEAYEIGKKLGITPTFSISIKADLKHQPYLIIAGAIIFTVIIIGFAVRNLERTFESDEKSSLDFTYLTNGWWLTVVTMTTVGYGDGYPSTHLGRFIMLITAVMSLIIVSLYVVALTVASMFNKEETKAYYMIKKHGATLKARDKAANVIKCSFRLKMLLSKKNDANYLKRIFVCGGVLRRHIRRFCMETSLANTRYLPPSELLVQLEQKLALEINEIRKEIIDIQFIGERLDELMKHQDTISGSLDDILEMQNTIERDIGDLNIQKILKDSN